MRSARSSDLLFLGLILALSACSPDDGGAPRRVVRLAVDEWVESVASPDLAIVRGEAPPPRSGEVFRELAAFEDWSWFLTANAFGEGPVVSLPADRPLDRLDRAEQGVLVTKALGVAAWIETEGAGVVEVDAIGRFDGPTGLTMSVVPLDVAPERLDALVRPGRLRALRRDHIIGLVRALKPIEGARRATVRFRPEAKAKSLLVLAVARGDESAALERVTVRRPGPFETLVADGRLSERFVADVSVAGITRPSFVLTAGTSVTTKPLVIPPDATLVYQIAGLPGARAAGAQVEVTCISDDRTTGFGGSVEFDGRWIPCELSGAFVRGSPVRLRFSCEASDMEARPVAVVGAPRIVPPPPSAPTHLLLISLDTVRADRLGAYGNDRGLTPHLDRLAARGTVFENAYTNAPYTLPSHVTLFSGLLPDAHGVKTFRDRIPSAAPWLPSELADAGYETAAFTSGGYVGFGFGFGRGFDLYCEVDPIGDRYFPGHAAHCHPFPDGETGALSRALAWLGGREGRPTFLFLHTYMAHDYLPPPALAREFGLLADGAPPLTVEAVRRFEARRVARDGLSEDDRRRLVDAYDATVKACDEMVGETLAALEASGMAERTIVVVTSDHGEELLDHGGTGHGVTLYEEVVRVPLLVCVPGRGEGRRVARRVSHVDLAPTLLELMGRAPPAAMRGRSFAAAIDGEELTEAPIVLDVDDPPRAVRRAIIENGWKLHLAEDDEAFDFHPRAPRELFRLADDVTEEEERLAENAEIAGTLAEHLGALRAEAARHRAAIEAASGGVDGPISAELEATLRELGYLGGR